jgi:uncharacterized protein (UPF0264 family)
MMLMKTDKGETVDVQVTKEGLLHAVMPEPITRVVYRTWNDGEVVALFPDIDETRGCCMSYVHVGQHGGADYTGVVRMTKPATQEQYSPLHAELTSIGYNLKITQRR